MELIHFLEQLKQRDIVGRRSAQKALFLSKYGVLAEEYYKQLCNICGAFCVEIDELRAAWLGSWSDLPTSL